ncbi:AMP-binding protein, partial [Spongiibacter tropicus]
PTETTIWSTMMILDKIGNSAPPIGRPIANTQVYVLDEKMALLPPGVPGELYIGGAGVALGYHNRPDLTAERFVDNPYGEGRLYKTGDQARWRRDGVLEYLGRNDFQIKIRGFRVETEEIETHLLRCVGVRRAAVALRKDPAGQPRLVAYLLPEEGFDADSEALQASALRLQIETSLPDYMLPSHYELVSDLPL